eukprot:2943676-Pyramimonas_sp.AAC.1
MAVCIRIISRAAKAVAFAPQPRRFKVFFCPLLLPLLILFLGGVCRVSGTSSSSPSFFLVLARSLLACCTRRWNRPGRPPHKNVGVAWGVEGDDDAADDDGDGDDDGDWEYDDDDNDDNDDDAADDDDDDD